MFGVSSKRKHTCETYCSGRIAGIVENLKLRGEISQGFEVEVKMLKGLRWIPAGSYVMTCEHRRDFLVKPRAQQKAVVGND